MKLKPGYSLFLAICFACFFSSVFSQTTQHTLTTGSLTRTYYLHVPEDLPDETVPLLFVFHGGGGTAKRTINFTGFNEIADREKFIVCYPQGYKNSWADARGISKANQAGVDDVNFVNLLIREISKEHKIYQRRIYAVGISNGGFMCQRLACELSSQFAGFVSIAANLPENAMSNCFHDDVRSILYILGTKDPLVPYEGGFVKLGKSERGKVFSARVSCEFWAERAECDSVPKTETMPDLTPDGVTCKKFTWSGTGMDVALIRMEGAGHIWPGKTQYLPEKMIGKLCSDFDGSEIAWDFLKGYSTFIP